MLGRVESMTRVESYSSHPFQLLDSNRFSKITRADKMKERLDSRLDMNLSRVCNYLLKKRCLPLYDSSNKKARLPEGFKMCNKHFCEIRLRVPSNDNFKRVLKREKKKINF